LLKNRKIILALSNEELKQSCVWYPEQTKDYLQRRLGVQIDILRCEAIENRLRREGLQYTWRNRDRLNTLVLHPNLPGVPIAQRDNIPFNNGDEQLDPLLNDTPLFAHEESRTRKLMNEGNI